MKRRQKSWPNFENYETKRYFALKKIMITGASSGIGRACAFWFLNQGARVALVGRDKFTLDKIGEQFPHQVVTIQCDFAIDINQYDLVVSAVEALGGLDILINSAGLIFENDLESTFPQDHDYLIDINLRSVFHITSMCAPFLMKSVGCIVNLSAEWGNRPQQGMISYCITKAGIDMLTKCLALELAPVRVNAVAPGLTKTNFFNYLNIDENEQNWIYKRLSDTTPLKRIAMPEDIAKAIVFLCSKKASKITGQILRVDGGRHITSSSFTHWDSSAKMSNKIFPMPEVNIVESEVKRKNMMRWRINVRAMLEKSKWYTDTPDSHAKIQAKYIMKEFDFDPIEQEDEEDNIRKECYFDVIEQEDEKDNIENELNFNLIEQEDNIKEGFNFDLIKQVDEEDRID
ncbi:hypothetical protein SteCoe_4390 [Stentor coeruleus]|uniref:Uncharacterized protein n=1 Tax=Stentor coeruleus TaxID=5963 RepID=A0A1R2CUU1_9CILI|nr:hypothetical protein SteCoe_4390 [Stentor coeruleus]